MSTEKRSAYIRMTVWLVVLAALVQEVGEHQPVRVVQRVFEDAGEERLALAHAVTPWAAVLGRRPRPSV